MGSAVCKVHNAQIVDLEHIFTNFANCDTIYFNGYVQAIQESPQMAKIFQVKNAKSLNPPEVAWLENKAHVFHEFLAKAVNFAASDDFLGLEKMCRQLGARHVAYCKGKFNDEFFDSFIWSLAEQMDSLEERPNFESMVKWQKFMRLITDLFIEGFEDGMC